MGGPWFRDPTGTCKLRSSRTSVDQHGVRPISQLLPSLSPRWDPRSRCGSSGTVGVNQCPWPFLPFKTLSVRVHVPGWTDPDSLIIRLTVPWINLFTCMYTCFKFFLFFFSTNLFVFLLNVVDVTSRVKSPFRNQKMIRNKLGYGKEYTVLDP